MRDDGSPEPPTGDRGTPMMLVGAVAGGLSAYLFHALGGRGLGADAYAPIGVMWTIAFITVAVVYVPLEQWVTRETTRGLNPLSGGRRLLVTVVLLAMALAALAAGLTLSPLTGEVGVHVIQMLVLVGGYGFFRVGMGMLEGRGRFGRVGWMLCAEGGLRLAAAGVVLTMGGGAVGLGWAMAAAPWVAFLFAFWRGYRSDTPSVAGAVFVQQYVVGSLAAHILVAGAPLIVTYLDATPAQVSVAFIVFVLFRAPVTLMYSLQGRILPPLVRMFTRGEEEPLRKLGRRLWTLSAALGVLGGVFGFLLGPPVVRLLMSSVFVPSAPVAALVLSGTMMAAGVQLIGQILVARSRTGRLATAWVLGLAAAALVVWLSPHGPVLAVAIGFWVGEVIALALVGSMAMSRRYLTDRAPASSGDGRISDVAPDG